MEEFQNQTVRKSDKGEFDLKPIADVDKFQFSCHPGISCYNRCCHHINVMLTPFDVLRMKKHLGIRSDEFLAKYTLLQTFRETDVPLLMLKSIDDESNACVFMREEGCAVYDARPVVCRNYPAGVATQDPTEGQSSMPNFIIEEEMCKGHCEGPKWTVDEWKQNQASIEIEALNKPWLEIVSRLKSLRLKDDKDQKINVFIMVSFDQDTFREMVFGSSFLDRFDVSQDQADLIRNDEDELLKFGIRWLQFILFKEGTMRPKK